MAKKKKDQKPFDYYACQCGFTSVSSGGCPECAKSGVGIALEGRHNPEPEEGEKTEGAESPADPGGDEPPFP